MTKPNIKNQQYIKNVATVYFAAVASVLILPIISRIIDILVQAEFNGRMPITYNFQGYVDALKVTAPPIIDSTTLTIITAILVALALVTIMYISAKYPRHTTNSRRLLWVGGGLLVFAFLMMVDMIVESINTYHLHSFGGRTNGFLADGLEQVVYYVAIPICVGAAIIFLTINFLRKTKEFGSQINRMHRKTKSLRKS